MAIIKKTTNTNVSEDVEERTHLMHCWWGGKLVQSLLKTVWRFLKRFKIELPCVYVCVYSVASVVTL